jgi:acyl-coenzyme A thioesterase PaaI-like protein
MSKLSHDGFQRLKKECDEIVKNQQSIQDQWEDMGTHCWGCGKNNELGLQIKSCWIGDEAICVWQPKQYHAAMLGILNGGIIATVMDCHCLNTASAWALKHREFSKPYLTGLFEIKYLRPASTEKPILLRARIKEMKGRKITVTCSLFSEGIEEECAHMELVAVSVT